MLKTHSLGSVVYLSVFTTLSFHINKYILSILNFTYPTVFQGWQTLVTVILMKLAVSDQLVPFRWKHFAAHMHLFICFTGNIVAGSKALSVLPIPIVIAVTNFIPALNHIVRSHYFAEKDYVSFFVCFLCICSVVCIFCLDSILSEIKISCVWTITHLILSWVQTIIEQTNGSSTYSPLDKLFYSNLFSVIVLAPSSFYLQEAFLALDFEERRQLRFLVGCVMSGVLGTILSNIRIHTCTNPFNSEAVSRALCCFLSPFILPCSLSSLVWIIVAFNVLISCFVPSTKDGVHILKSVNPSQSELV